MTGASSVEVSEYTKGRAVHFTVTAREALLLLLSTNQRYIEDSVRVPALIIGVEVKEMDSRLGQSTSKKIHFRSQPKLLLTSVCGQEVLKIV